MKTIRPMNTERQKTAAKFSLAALLFTACSLLFLPGCQNPLQSIETPQTTGAGTFSLTIGGAARTIVPVLSVDRFERFAIAFEPAYGCEAGNAGFSHDDWEPGHGASPSAPILLSVGFWDVTVTAFTATDDEYPAAVGFILGLEMVAGESVNENIVLGPVIDGEGAFSWRDITFPEIVRMAGMEIFEWYDWNIGERLYAIELVADGDPVGGHPYRSLYAGQYFVLFTLRGEDDDEMMEISHILHIYRNIETELPAGMFADFAFPGPVILLYIAEQIAILQGKAEPPLGHTLTIDFANEQIAPQVLYFGGREIAITLTGGVGGDTLSLSDPGAMFTVGEGVTLILDGVELRGMADNHSALVLVEEDGHLVMLAGSMITGNTNISDTFVGGGVTVNSGGTFDMYAGEISGNNTAALGGGVANAGAFTLRDGVISENTADWGGGVYNRNTLSIYGGLISENIAAFGGGVFNNRADGTFNMHDGIISENTADMGGGVFNWATGTFNMHGGVIAINNADVGNGGGVANQAAAFNMHGGTISGNAATGDGSAGGGVANWASSIFTMHDGIISENTASVGGGVANWGDGTFNMYDGIISENTASIGGGVANSGDGTFTMYGGVISSNEAMNNDGGGVFNLGAFTMHDGAISNNETPFRGGGVVNGIGGSFHMHGGAISGNTAGDGGGVLTQGAGWFAMRGGRIYNNTATGSHGWGGGVMNLEGIFFMSDGVIYGTNADVGLRNMANDMAALTNAIFPGGTATAMRGTFAVDGDNITFAQFANLPGTDFTLHVENGLLASPITATGITVTGIDAAYHNTEGRVYLFSGGNWVPLTGSETPIVGADVTFTWPALYIPLITWQVRLGFYDTTTGENVANYAATIPFAVPGITAVPFGLFDPITVVTTVTTITITGIPALYHSDDLVLFANGVEVGHVDWVRTATVTIPVNMEPGNHFLEMVFEVYPTFDVRSRYTLATNLTAGANIIPFGSFDRVGGPHPPPASVSSITVTGVGAYEGTIVDLDVWANFGQGPIWARMATENVLDDSVTFAIPIIWPSGNWRIRLIFSEYLGDGDWALVGAYLADPKTLVDGANTVALGDFENMLADASANAAPFGGAIEGRTPPTEMRTPRLDRPSQPETRERQTPRVDERTSPADRFMRLDERALPADGLMRIDEPTPFTDGLILHERLDAPSLEMDLDWQQLRQPRLMPQESLWPRR